MHLSSTLTLLAAIASPATSRSVPTIVSSTTPRARTVATHYGQWARLLVLEQRENRQAHDETIRPDKQELCLSFEAIEYSEYSILGREYNYGCDKAHENIVYTCKFTNGDGELCDETENYCVTDISTKMTMSLDFYIDEFLYYAQLESRSQFEESLKNVNLDDLLDEETCMTYTRVPTEMAELEGKESCISIEAGDDIDALSSEAMDPEDEFEITSCGFTLGDKPCKCSVCNNGIGVNLECPNIGIITEDCTNIRPLAWINAQDFTAAGFSVIPLTKTVPSSPGNLYIVPVSLCIGLLCWYKKGDIYDWFRYLTGAASDSNDPSNLEMREILSDSPSQDSTHIIYHPPIL